MNDRGSVQELFNLIKTVVDNYMKSRKPAAVLVGTYTGNGVMIEKLPIPMSMITGNAKSQLVSEIKYGFFVMIEAMNITFWRLSESHIRHSRSTRETAKPILLFRNRP